MKQLARNDLLFWDLYMNCMCIAPYFYKLCQYGFPFVAMNYFHSSLCRADSTSFSLAFFFIFPSPIPKKMKEKQKALIDLLPVNL